MSGMRQSNCGSALRAAAREGHLLPLFITVECVPIALRRAGAAAAQGSCPGAGKDDAVIDEILIQSPSGADSGIPDCGSTESPLDAMTGFWWLVHTKSRMEKALSADMDRLGVHHFLPLIQTRRRYGGRGFDVSLPLFPGYLFLCGSEDERYATLMTHRAAKVIPVVDQERLKAELRQVYRVTRGDQPVDLYPGLRRGCRCRVTSGSLAGLEGILLRRRGIYRVYVGVEALGQSAELEIDPAMLEVLD